MHTRAMPPWGLPYLPLLLNKYSARPQRHARMHGTLCVGSVVRSWGQNVVVNSAHQPGGHGLLLRSAVLPSGALCLPSSRGRSKSTSVSSGSLPLTAPPSTI